METMYDRLGDLLNETLEAGEIKFVKVEVEQKQPENPQNESATAENKENIGQAEHQEETIKEDNNGSMIIWQTVFAKLKILCKIVLCFLNFFHYILCQIQLIIF